MSAVSINKSIATLNEQVDIFEHSFLREISGRTIEDIVFLEANRDRFATQFVRLKKKISPIENLVDLGEKINLLFQEISLIKMLSAHLLFGPNLNERGFDMLVNLSEDIQTVFRSTRGPISIEDYEDIEDLCEHTLLTFRDLDLTTRSHIVIYLNQLKSQAFLYTSFPSRI